MWSLWNWIFPNHAELNEYCISYIAWLCRPLKNSLAASLNGKHSMINLKFTHHKRKTDKIELCVERHTDGIFQSNFISHTQLIGMCGKIYHAKRTKYSLHSINLQDFLIHCSEQNDIKYSVGSADCHCFSQYIWELCTINSILPKPNAYLVSVARIANYKLDHKNKATQRDLTRVNELDPRDKEHSEILRILAP
eukprot:632461_1